MTEEEKFRKQITKLEEKIKKQTKDHAQNVKDFQFEISQLQATVARQRYELDDIKSFFKKLVKEALDV